MGLDEPVLHAGRAEVSDRDVISTFAFLGLLCGLVDAVISRGHQFDIVLFGGLLFYVAVLASLSLVTMRGRLLCWTLRRMGLAFITVGVATGIYRGREDVDNQSLSPGWNFAFLLLPGLSAAGALSLAVWAWTRKWDGLIFVLLSLSGMAVALWGGPICQDFACKALRCGNPYTPCVASAFLLGQTVCGALFGYAFVRAGPAEQPRAEPPPIEPK